MYCLTVTYPKGEDTHFDFDYYRDTHIPLCESLFTDHGFCGTVLRTDQGKGPGSADLNYASVDLLFESAEHMQRALAAGGKEINGDIENYTNSKPQMSFSEISLALDTN